MKVYGLRLYLTIVDVDLGDFTLGVEALSFTWEGRVRAIVDFLRSFGIFIFMIFMVSIFGVGCSIFPQNQTGEGISTPHPKATTVQQTPRPSKIPELIPTQIEDTPDGDRPLPPLYLTIIIHNEEDMQDGTQPKDHIPDYDGDETLMLHFTKALRAFSQMASEHGARINFGSDWTFSKGVSNFDPTFYTDLESMGHEIDAHAHESFVLYHDVRDFITRASGNPSHVASGMNEQSIQRQMEYFDQYYPEFQILWGVSLPGHGAGECIATWVWRPSRTEWTVHDPEGKYIYIGHGELMNSLDLIQEAIDNRSLDRVNTYAVFATPRDFKAGHGEEGIDPDWITDPGSHNYWENRIQWWDEFLSEIDVWVDQGELEYATLSEIVELFGAVESRMSFHFEDCPRSDKSMTDRTREAGYFR